MSAIQESADIALSAIITLKGVVNSATGNTVCQILRDSLAKDQVWILDFTTVTGFSDRNFLEALEKCMGLARFRGSFGRSFGSFCDPADLKAAYKARLLFGDTCYPTLEATKATSPPVA